MLVDAFINVVSYNVDGKEGDSLSNCSSARLHRRCRLCMQTQTNSFIRHPNQEIIYRNDFEHELVGKRSWEIVSNYYIHKATNNILKTKKKQIQLNKDQKEIVARSKKLEIGNGQNSLFKLHYHLASLGITNFFSCLRPDTLHVLLGLLAHINNKILSCMQSIMKIDSSRVNIGEKLDLNLSYFNNKSSYSIVDSMRWSKGITGITNLKGKLKSMDGKCQLPLLYQTMFSIGEYGDIIPNTQSWLLDKCRNPKSYELIKNPTEVILSCCASVIEVVLMNDSKILGYDELDTFEYLISNANYHFLRLCMLNEVLEKSTFDEKRNSYVIGKRVYHNSS